MSKNKRDTMIEESRGRQTMKSSQLSDVTSNLSACITDRDSGYLEYASPRVGTVYGLRFLITWMSRGDPSNLRTFDAIMHVCQPAVLPIGDAQPHVYTPQM